MTGVWVNRSIALLRSSIEEPRHELNELDWKVGLSEDKKRLTQHLIAFANNQGGGFFAFGVDNAGTIKGVTTEEASAIVSQLANLSRDAVEPPLTIDYTIDQSFGPAVLLIHVKEAQAKPAHIRGKSIEEAFIRSGGTTRVASRQDLARLLLNSKPPRWEDLPASAALAPSEIISKLDSMTLLEMLERPAPKDERSLIEWFAQQKFIDPADSASWYITNLGAISAARELKDFPSIQRKALRVIQYSGLNKAEAKQETEGRRGYAVAFQMVIKHVTSLLPQSEVIAEALRAKRTVYPEIALREIIANALIHQDFTISGAGPLVELYADRIEISNPGSPLPGIKLDRLIGSPPESRNEQLAKSFRQYKICEERGSGLIKAGLQVELFGLPPIKFEQNGNSFKVTLFTPRTFAQMSARERLDSCYQHAVLKFLSSAPMTNKSLRERLKMPEKHRSMVSLVIQEAMSLNMIKAADPENRSTKHARYVPYWA